MSDAVRVPLVPIIITQGNSQEVTLQAKAKLAAG